MKKLFIFILLVSTFNSKAQTAIENLRKDYHLINTDSLSCAKLYERVKKTTFTDNTKNAYKGAITAAMAGFLKDPGTKLKTFKEGKNLLEESIKADASNCELRVLRLSIQTNCPKVLGYDKQIRDDKTFLLDHFQSVNDPVAKNMITDFIKQSPAFTESEKKKLGL